MNALRDRHVQVWVMVFIVMGCLVVGAFFGQRIGKKSVVYDYTVALQGVHNESTTTLQYGVWPALTNVDFFNTVHARMLAEKASFVEANLTAMTLSVYRDGVLTLTVPIKSKGKEGSWWETPAGLYKAEGKERTHFSSFGKVYMPYSIPFQGNFFIHGWPYHADGTPVPEGYSGGCIRLEDGYAEQVYNLVEVGMPIVVFEEGAAGDTFTYVLAAPDVSAQSYLVADLDTNFVLLGNGENKARESNVPTTLTSALVASEYQNIEYTVTTREGMPPDMGEARLMPGATYSIYDLLFPLLLRGSPSAVYALADYFGEQRFAMLLNAKAGAIGMRSTLFEWDEKGIQGRSSAEDLFMLLKYLRTNRSFVLGMSAGSVNTSIYGTSVFADASSTHPFFAEKSFLGGAVDVRAEQNNTLDAEAAVLMVFATSTRAHDGGGDDMVTVLSVPFGEGVRRPIAFVVLDSAAPEKDTRAMLAQVTRMYR